MMSAFDLRGSIVPIVTPFRNGELDLDSLGQLIEWQIASGSHGISVTGTTGEPSSLTLDERKRVITAAHEAVNGRVPFVPGTGSTNHAETLELTRYAAALGVDAVLLITPYYNRPSQNGLFQHFDAVAKSVDAPVILYNIPGRTAVNLEVDTVARLREANRNLIGVKESNKDFEHINRLLHKLGRDFLVYSGIELLCFPILAIGGAGYISATGNPTMLLRPNTIACLPAICTPLRTSSSMHPAGVHGSNSGDLPFIPSMPMSTGSNPSTFFARGRWVITRASLRCLGKGNCTRMPCTSSRKAS